MKKMTIKLSVALLTFCLGVVTTLFYFTRNNPNTDVPQAKQIENPPRPSCFPGLSVERNAIDSKLSSYFVQGLFSENQRLDQFRIDWYSKHLKAMDEPSLLSRVEGESYRFLWLRSFHHPIVMRVRRSVGAAPSLFVKQLSGAGGYDPGKLVINQTRSLTEAEWNEFISLLEKSCYWRMPVTEERMLADGAQWILESVKDHRYYIIDRQSPESGNYREACLFLLKMSDLKIPSEDVY